MCKRASRWEAFFTPGQGLAEKDGSERAEAGVDAVSSAGVDFGLTLGKANLRVNH